MKLPNWFKIIWWLVLVSVLSTFLVHRYPELAAGHAVPADIVVFVIWVALLLAPIFSEVSLLGITLKQKLDDLKDYVANQITDVRNDVRNAVDIRTTFSPHINIPAPATDAQLPEIEKRIKSAVSDALAEHGIQQPPPPTQVTVSKEVGLLFATRYNLEKELRRISETRQLMGEARRVSPQQLIRELSHAGLLESRLANAIREVYSVCTPAIHGESVTQAQVTFVQDVSPGLITALRAIT